MNITVYIFGMEMSQIIPFLISNFTKNYNFLKKKMAKNHFFGKKKNFDSQKKKKKTILS